MNTVADLDFATDAEDNRVLVLENGNKLYLKRTDPHGFFYYNLDKGQLPPYMKCAFTGIRQAKEVLIKYLSERKEASNEVSRKELRAKSFKTVKPEDTDTPAKEY